MKVVVDSSILIEHLKGTKTNLLEGIFREKYVPCFNSIVFSEYIYHFLSISSNKAPFTLKKNKEIQNYLTTHEPIKLVEDFTFLPDNRNIVKLSYKFMKTYNLLPNDALILASCKYFNVSNLASYDTDFTESCAAESIHLIKDAVDLAKEK